MNQPVARVLISILFTFFLLLPDIGLAQKKTVKVKGYYRKDGTYVRPHYRSPPGSKRSTYTPSFSTSNSKLLGQEWPKYGSRNQYQLVFNSLKGGVKHFEVMADAILYEDKYATKKLDEIPKGTIIELDPDQYSSQFLDDYYFRYKYYKTKYGNLDGFVIYNSINPVEEITTALPLNGNYEANALNSLTSDSIMSLSDLYDNVLDTDTSKDIRHEFTSKEIYENLNNLVLSNESEYSQIDTSSYVNIANQNEADPNSIEMDQTDTYPDKDYVQTANITIQFFASGSPHKRFEEVDKLGEIIIEQVALKNLFRYKLGYFDSEDEARLIIIKLNKMGFSSAFISN